MGTLLPWVRDWRPRALQRRVAVAIVSVAVAAVILACSGTYTCLAPPLPKPTFPLVYFTGYEPCGYGGSDFVSTFDTQPATAPTGALTAQFNANGAICYNVSPAPALADGTLFTGSDHGSIFALDSTTLTQRWEYPLPGNAHGVEFLLSTPAIAAGVVYVTTNEDDTAAGGYWTTRLWIRALAYTATGVKPVWSRELPVNHCSGCALLYPQSSPTVANGIVYVGSETGTVFAFDAATGAVRWTYDTLGAKPAALHAVCSRPAVANGLVYIAGGDGSVYALDAATSEFRWQYNTGVLNDAYFVCGSPAVANGAVYFATVDGTVYAFDAQTGKVGWTLTLNSHTHSSVRVDHGTLYIGTESGELYAVDANRGGVRWIYTTPTGGEIVSTPAVDNGIVYFGSLDNWVYAINPPRVCAAPGATLAWKYNTGAPIMASPAFGPK
jgi:outer membrane protein assembly factor BamB